LTLKTVRYYAPEQAQGKKLTPAVDVYSLGIVMYEMFTGTLPFDGNTPLAVAMGHSQDIPKSPSHLNPAIPRELERIILRCLEKDPAARYQTGEALCQALGALSLERSDTIAMRSASAPGSSETPTAPIVIASARRPRWRRRALGGALATLALVVLIGTPLAAKRGWFGSRQSPASVPPAAHTGAKASGTVPDTTVTTPSSGDTRSGDGSRAGGSVGVRPSDAAGGTASVHHLAHPSPAASSTAVNTPGQATSASTALATPAAPDKERGFGTVHLDTKPPATLYTFQALDDGRVIRGRTPLTGPITLPVGTYAVIISARYCASYRDTVHIAMNHAAPPLKVRLVCGE